MASNLFGPGTTIRRTAADIKADEDTARAADASRQRAVAAAGPDRRSIGVSRRVRDDADEM